MNGAQDLGGQHGFGPVIEEVDEPPFHHEWERRAFALTLAMGGTGSWTIDASRHARESLPPAQYLASSYYEIWTEGLIKLMLERGLVDQQELETGTANAPAKAIKRVLAADDVDATLAKGSPCDRSPLSDARFAPGDQVVAKIANKKGHTRLPRYLHGRRGTIARVHGVHVFPDTNAHGQGEHPQWLYSVAFKAADLWGVDADPGGEVMADLWDSYLEPDDRHV